MNGVLGIVFLHNILNDTRLIIWIPVPICCLWKNLQAASLVNYYWVANQDYLFAGQITLLYFCELGSITNSVIYNYSLMHKMPTKLLLKYLYICIYNNNRHYKWGLLRDIQHHIFCTKLWQCLRLWTNIMHLFIVIALFRLKHIVY